MQNRSQPDQEIAKRAKSAKDVSPGVPEGGHSVLEQIERSESLPATLSATEAFAVVIGALMRRLPADQAEEFVERRLPTELRILLEEVAAEPDESTGDSDLSEYLEDASRELQLDSAQTDELVRVVIGSLRLLMSGEEVEAIAVELPPQLEALWREACDVPGAQRPSGLP